MLQTGHLEIPVEFPDWVLIGSSPEFGDLRKTPHDEQIQALFQAHFTLEETLCCKISLYKL